MRRWIGSGCWFRITSIIRIKLTIYFVNFLAVDMINEALRFVNFSKQFIERTLDFAQLLFTDMRIGQGRFDIGMPKQLLYKKNVCSSLQQMGRKTMTQRVV